MYSCGGPYRDIYNHVLVCMAMYPFPISIPIFGYFKPLYDNYTKYLPYQRLFDRGLKPTQTAMQRVHRPSNPHSLGCQLTATAQQLTVKQRALIR